MVDSQISAVVCLFSDSCEICIPKASEKASAIAIVRMPPITATLELVPDSNPTINPRVVIIPDVRPKLSPVFRECLRDIFKLVKLKNRPKSLKR